MAAPQLTVQIQGQTVSDADRLNTYMQSCDVVAELRGFVGVPGIEVALRGLAAVNDGGGGFFYWDDSATGPDDGVNVIVPTGSAIGAWIRLNLSGGSTAVVDVVLTWTGAQTAAAVWLGGEKFTRAVTFPQNFAGSAGLIPKTLPATSYVVDIRKNGVSFGTATSNTSGIWTFASAGAVSFAIDGYIDFYGPGDTTIANFGLTLLASSP